MVPDMLDPLALEGERKPSRIRAAWRCCRGRLAGDEGLGGGLSGRIVAGAAGVGHLGFVGDDPLHESLEAALTGFFDLLVGQLLAELEGLDEARLGVEGPVDVHERLVVVALVHHVAGLAVPELRDAVAAPGLEAGDRIAQLWYSKARDMMDKG